MAPRGVFSSWAIAAVTASTLRSRFVRSRRCKIIALASREYRNVVSVSNTVNNIELPIRTKQRAEYQPTVNRTELAIAATIKLGIQASNVTINHRSRIVRLRSHKATSAAV